jgi:hypothetical protein
MEVSGQLQFSVALPHHEDPLVPVGLAAGWPSEAVWTLWSKEKYIPPAGN